MLVAFVQRSPSPFLHATPSFATASRHRATARVPATCPVLDAPSERLQRIRTRYRRLGAAEAFRLATIAAALTVAHVGTRVVFARCEASLDVGTRSACRTCHRSDGAESLRAVAARRTRAGRQPLHVASHPAVQERRREASRTLRSRPAARRSAAARRPFVSVDQRSDGDRRVDRPQPFLSRLHEPIRRESHANARAMPRRRGHG